MVPKPAVPGLVLLRYMELLLSDPRTCGFFFFFSLIVDVLFLYCRWNAAGSITETQRWVKTYWLKTESVHPTVVLWETPRNVNLRVDRSFESFAPSLKSKQVRKPFEPFSLSLPALSIMAVRVELTRPVQKLFKEGVCQSSASEPRWVSASRSARLRLIKTY